MGKVRKWVQGVQKFTKRYKKAVIGGLLACFAVGLVSITNATDYGTLVMPGDMPYKLHGHPTGLKCDTGEKYFAYCLTPELAQPNGDSYTDGGPADDKEYTILGYGYPNYSYTGDREADYFITQMAMWKYIAGFDLSEDKIDVASRVRGNTATSPGDGSKAKQGDIIDSALLSKCANDLYDYAMAHPRQEGIELHFYNGDTRLDDVGIAFSASDGSKGIPSGYMVSEPMTIDMPNSRWTYPDGMDAVLSGTVTGAKFRMTDGNTDLPKIKDIKEKQEFRILYPDNEANKGKEVVVQASGPVKVWKSCMSTNNANKQNLAVVWKASENYTLVARGSGTGTPTEKKGAVQIIKTDKATKKPLAGAEFTLYDGSNKVVSKKTTSADGLAEWKYLLVGKYTIKETKAPKGFDLSTETWKPNVTADNKVSNSFECQDGKLPDVHIPDIPDTEIKIPKPVPTPHATVEINKTSDDGRPLAGAEFTIYNKAGTHSYTGTTDVNGYLKFTDIAGGETTIAKYDGAANGKEGGKITPGNPTEGPSSGSGAGSGDSRSGSGSESGSSSGSGSSGGSTDPGSGSTDPSGGSGSAGGGVTPGVYEGKGAYVENGYLVTPPVEGSNDYIVKETKAPTGYETCQTTKEFTISEDGKVFKFDFVDKKIKQGEISLTKEDSQGYLLQGVEFELLNEDGELIQKGTTDWYGNLTFKNVPYTSGGSKYYLRETGPLAGFVHLDQDQVVVLDDSNPTTHYKLTNHKKYYRGSIDVLKKDDDNKTPIQGAVIALFDSTGKMIGQKMSGANGETIWDNLDLGDYFYQEVQAPKGYKLDTTKYKLTITERHLDIQSILPNKKYGSLDVYKVDADDSIPLEGVEFSLYDANKNFITKGITNGNGHLIFDQMEIGTYYIKETQALPGYQLDPNFHEMTISDRVRYSAITIRDKKYGTLLLHKTDDLGNPLQGAYFQLYNKNMQPIGQPKASQGNGEILWDHVELGQYYVKEVQAPAGYQIMNAVKGLEITENHRTSEITISNQIIYGSLTIVKTNENMHALRGAEFTIYNDQNQPVETKATTTNGTVIFEHLPCGYYTIKETKPPIGYIPLVDTVQHTGDEVMNCEVTIRHLDQEINLSNKLILGSVHLIKSDVDDGHKLPDTLFALYDSTGTEVGSAMTDVAGEAWFKNIKFGHYTIREIAQPTGYEQNDTVYDVDISTDGQILEKKITNKKIMYNLVLNKADTETNKALAGAKFQLVHNGVAMKDGEKDIFITDSNGTISFPFNLDYGTYDLFEVEPPYGYYSCTPVHVILDDTTQYTRDRANNRIVRAQAYDQSKRGELKITKVDADTGLPLQNAKYEILNEDQSQVLTKGETGDTGIVSFPLALGTYWFKEYEAPEGYSIDTASYKVEITDTSYGLIQMYRVTNKASQQTPPGGTSTVTEKNLPKLELTKVDKATGNTLANAGFAIYAEDKTTVVQRGMTNDQGIVSFQLPKGNYYYLEYQAPNGYKLDEEMHKIILDEDNQVLECQVDDIAITAHTPDVVPNVDTPVITPSVTPTITPKVETPKGEIDICKTDVSTGAVLPNATFKIYASDKSTVVVSGTTDETGLVRFKLPAGDYFYQEFSAPSGFEVDNTLFPFSIRENGQILKCQMTDVPTTKPKSKLANTGDIIRNNLPVICGLSLVIIGGATFLMARRTRRFR